MPGVPRRRSPGCWAGPRPAVPRPSCGSEPTRTRPRGAGHAGLGGRRRTDDGGRLALDELIAGDPEHHPGPRRASPSSVPACRSCSRSSPPTTPLSLQVHPTLEQARAGFAREEAAGVGHSAAGAQLQGRQPQAGDDLRADAVRGAVRFPAGRRSPARSSCTWAPALTWPGLELPPLLVRLLDDLARPDEPAALRSAFERLIAGGEDVSHATAMVAAALVSGAPMAPYAGGAVHRGQPQRTSTPGIRAC